MAQSEIVRLLYEHWLHSGNMAGKAAGSNEAVFALACEELIAELEENESDCEEFVG